MKRFMFLKSRDRILLSAVILAGAVLRFFRIASKSFWCDEFLAISLSRLRFSDMLGWVIRNDAHPPLFYSIVSFLFRFTQSEAGLRILPAVFGAGAILLFYLLLRQMRPKDYFLPLCLFALSPAAVLWSQTVKSYSMLTFFSLLSLLMFFSFGKTRKIVYAAGWILSALIAVYLHNYGAVILFAQAVTVFLRRKEFPLKFFLFPFLVIALGYLPYLAGPVFSQLAFVKGATHTVTNPFLRTAYAFYYFIFGETLSPLNFPLVLPGIVFFAGFLLKGLFSKRDSLQVFSTVVFITAVAMIFSVKATIPQNLIHLQPFFFAIVAAGIAGISKKWKKVASSILAVLFLIPPLYFYHAGKTYEYHDAGRLIPHRQVTRLIQAEEREGEVVIITEQKDKRFSEFFEPYSPWDWYYKGGLPVVEVSAATVTAPVEGLKHLLGEYDGFWLILNYGLAPHHWNDEVKNFFLEGKSVKMEELKLIKNYSFLDVLRGKGRAEHYLIEVYHIRKLENGE
ncbi:MAG: glycosyltransferase family 39 protein [Candidatus Omnitrophica bacterium]|nr:glycosyltransferase family 39 protein [Candidatus Omnitrophota bacterium]